MISSEPGRDPGVSQEAVPDADRRENPDEQDGARRDPDVIDVLRGIWTATGQTSAGLDELFGPARSCKSMQNVGFDGFADAGSGDLRTAWRATLEREGKLSEQPGTVRDLVLGPAEHGDR